MFDALNLQTLSHLHLGSKDLLNLARTSKDLRNFYEQEHASVMEVYKTQRTRPSPTPSRISVSLLISI